MNKSFGGYNNKSFYIEAGAILVSLFYFSSHLGSFYSIIWWGLSLSMVFFYSTRWFNEVVFNRDDVKIVLRQAFYYRVHQIRYSQIKRVIFKNYSYTSPSNIIMHYEHGGLSYTVKFPYNYYKDKTDNLIDDLRHREIDVVVTGYGL